MASTAPQVRTMSTSETRTISCDMQGFLDEGDTLTGTPTIADATTELGISGGQVSTGVLTINGASVPAGEAVQFTCAASGATAGTTYTISIVCSTTNGETVHGDIRLKVI